MVPVVLWTLAGNPSIVTGKSSLKDTLTRPSWQQRCTRCQTHTPPTMRLTPYVCSWGLHWQWVVERECTRKKGQGLWSREKPQMNWGATFRKTKERLPGAGLVNSKIQRKYTNWRILPQEGARSMEQVYPNKVGESPRYKLDKWQVSPTWRQLVKIRRGDREDSTIGCLQETYFSFKDNRESKWGDGKSYSVQKFNSSKI